MQQHDLLRTIGFSEDTIQELVSKRVIEVKNSDYVICDGDILLNVIEMCINKGVNPKAFLIPPMIESFDEELDLLYRFLSEENYKLAEDVCDELINKVETSNLKLLKESLSLYPDTNEYILKDYVYPSEVTREGLHKIERRLVIDLEKFDYTKALDEIEILNKIYPEVMSTPFFNNVYGLLAAISDMTEDHTYISSQNPLSYIGDLNVVLNNLITSSDFYRATELINRGVSNDYYSIEWRVYSCLIDQVRYINDKNTQTLKLRSIIDASVSDNLNEALPNEMFPNFTRKQVEEIEKTDLEEYDSHDYYADYEIAYFEEHDYKKAKECLLKHMRQESLDGLTECYDYLLEELNILIRNEEAGIDSYRMNSAYEFGLKYMKECNYKDALNYFARCSNLLEEKSPRFYTLIAKCYKELQMYDKSAKYYKIAFDGLIAPDDILDMMEVLYKLGDYDGVSNAFGRYQFYHPYENVKAHYIASAAYYKMGLFEEALGELDVCTDILEMDENLPIDFIEEKKAIEDAKNGKKSEFSIDDYIEYRSTPEENQMSYYLDENLAEAKHVMDTIEEDNKSYNAKLEYVLSVAKVLFEACRYDDGLELVYLVDEYIDNDLLSKEDQKIYRKMINNYKGL